MMALFNRLLLLAIYISVTTRYATAVIQASDGFTECRIPDNSSINHVHTNLTEEELDVLQIEGHCFLFCTTDRHLETYSSEVNNNAAMIGINVMVQLFISTQIGDSNYSLSSYWPFVSINQSDCMITFKVNEVTVLI